MASNPLTYSEIEAFARLSRIELTAWEADLYCRLDDAVLAAWADETQTSNPAEEEPSAIPVSDVASLKAMLKGTAARTRMVAEAKAQAKALRRHPQA